MCDSEVDLPRWNSPFPPSSLLGKRRKGEGCRELEENLPSPSFPKPFRPNASWHRQTHISLSHIIAPRFLGRPKKRERASSPTLFIPESVAFSETKDGVWKVRLQFPALPVWGMSVDSWALFGSGALLLWIGGVWKSLGKSPQRKRRLLFSRRFFICLTAANLYFRLSYNPSKGCCCFSLSIHFLDCSPPTSENILRSEIYKKYITLLQRYYRTGFFQKPDQRKIIFIVFFTK